MVIVVYHKPYAVDCSKINYSISLSLLFLYMLDSSYIYMFHLLILIPKILFPVAREKCYKQISAAIAKYREIKENINEGLKFYVTLQVCEFYTICLIESCTFTAQSAIIT